MDHSYVNQVTVHNEVRNYYRDDSGNRRCDVRRGEFACFLKLADVQAVPGRLRMLRDLPTSILQGYREEGSWLRLVFANYEARKNFIFGHNSLLAHFGIEAFEGDVNPGRRYVADHGVTVAAPRRLYLDIETDSRVPFTRKEEARVLSVAFVGDDGFEHLSVLPEDSNAAERDLMAELWEICLRYDQVLAWNGDGFDFPVLGARSGLCNVRPDIRPLLLLDQLLVFKKQNSAESGDEKQSMKLETICQSILGYGKNPFDASRTWEAWKAGGKDRDEMAAYNMQDTRLLPALEKKTGYVALFQTLCDVTGVFPETRSIQPMVQFDSFMLRLGYQNDHRFKTREFGDEREHTKFGGAFVFPFQEKGILSNVHVCDFAGLYPNIIRTWNMSPETKHIDKHTGPAEERAPGHCLAPRSGVQFSTEHEGILPKALSTLGTLRKVWSKKQAEFPVGSIENEEARRRSVAYKVAMNSFYGVLGSPYCRLYDKDIAYSITSSAVHLIQATMDASREAGMQVIYGDSITGERTVIVKSPTGDKFIAPIGKLYDEMPCGQMVNGDDGKSYLTVSPGWMAMGRDAHGQEGWFPLKRIMRHLTKKTLHTIHTRRGSTRCTSDHGIMQGSEQVTPREFIMSGAKFDCVSADVAEPRRIDLLDYVSHARLERRYKGRKLVREFRAMDDWILLDGWGNAEASRIRRFYDPGSEELKALLRLIGAYVSEGSVGIPGMGSCRWLFSIAQDDADWLLALQSDLNSITMGVYSSVMLSGGNTHALRATSPILNMVFLALGGQRSRDKKLPPFALDLLEEDRNELLRIMFEGDGHQEPKGYTSNSMELTAAVSYLLSQCGREHGFYYREEKRCWSIRTRPNGSERNRIVGAVNYLEEYTNGEYVYDLEVEGSHTFVDGLGRVLLHNTDSVFVGNTTEDGFRTFVDWCNKELYPYVIEGVGCTSNYIDLAYEKEFARVVFVSSKKYIGRYAHYKGTRPEANAKPEVRGMEWRRGDACKIARDMQWEAIDLIITKNVSDPAVFTEMILRWKKKVLEGELTADEIKVSKALKKMPKDYAVTNKTKADGTPFKLPSHVQVALLLMKRGEEIREGIKIEFIVMDQDAEASQSTGDDEEEDCARAIPVSDYKGECDRFYLWESLVYPPTQRLLDAAFFDEDWKRFKQSRPSKRIRKMIWVPPGQGALFDPKGVPKLNLEECEPEQMVAPTRPKEFVIEIDESKHGTQCIPKLKEVLSRYPGRKPVMLRMKFHKPDREVTMAIEYKVSVSPALLEAVKEILQ